MPKFFDTLTLAKNYPDAFNALPEPYQNDDCLEFFIDSGVLYSRPKKGQESILGNWVAEFYSYPDEKEWVVSPIR